MLDDQKARSWIPLQRFRGTALGVVTAEILVLRNDGRAVGAGVRVVKTNPQCIAGGIHQFMSRSGILGEF